MVPSIGAQHSSSLILVVPLASTHCTGWIVQEVAAAMSEEARGAVVLDPLVLVDAHHNKCTRLAAHTLVKV